MLLLKSIINKPALDSILGNGMTLFSLIYTKCTWQYRLHQDPVWWQHIPSNLGSTAAVLTALTVICCFQIVIVTCCDNWRTVYIAVSINKSSYSSSHTNNNNQIYLLIQGFPYQWH